MSYKQTALTVISAFLTVCKPNCQYREKWQTGVYQVPSTGYPVILSSEGHTLFECLASCFVHTETCQSINYWSNTTRCDFFQGPREDEKTTQETSDHAIHAFIPPDMNDVVGGCGEASFPGCYLDRFNRPQASQTGLEDDGTDDPAL